MVVGATLELLVKVLETIPYVSADPRLGAVAANAASVCANERSAANPTLAKRLKYIMRLRTFFVCDISNSPFLTYFWTFPLRKPSC